MKNWRPNDWKDRYEERAIVDADDFEAGADAILEALVKDGWLEECNRVNEDPEEVLNEQNLAT